MLTVETFETVETKESMGRKVVFNDFENPSMHHRMYHVQTLIT